MNSVYVRSFIKIVLLVYVTDKNSVFIAIYGCYDMFLDKCFLFLGKILVTHVTSVVFLGIDIMI